MKCDLCDAPVKQGQNRRWYCTDPSCSNAYNGQDSPVVRSYRVVVYCKLSHLSDKDHYLDPNGQLEWEPDRACKFSTELEALQFAKAHCERDTYYRIESSRVVMVPTVIWE